MRDLFEEEIMNTLDLCRDIWGFCLDVNSREIMSHVADNSLEDWCKSWKSAVKCRLIDILGEAMMR